MRTVTGNVAARRGCRRRVAPVRLLPAIAAVVSLSTPRAWTLNANTTEMLLDDGGRRDRRRVRRLPVWHRWPMLRRPRTSGRELEVQLPARRLLLRSDLDAQVRQLRRDVWMQRLTPKS